MEKKYVKTSIEAFKQYDESKFNPRMVYQSKEMRVILAYFMPGQFIPVHSPGIDVVLSVLKGKGEVVADQDRFNVNEGDLVVIPRGVARGILAKTEMTVLHVVQPIPSEEDHKDVHSKLQQGRFV